MQNSNTILENSVDCPDKYQQNVDPGQLSISTYSKKDFNP